MGMMDDAIPDRYEKNPMLVLVENYILDALGVLEPEKVKMLNEIVCRTFGGKEWRGIIREQFQLPPGTDETLKVMWKQRQEEAEAQQVELSVEDFAREQADGVFREMGE